MSNRKQLMPSLSSMLFFKPNYEKQFKEKWRRRGGGWGGFWKKSRLVTWLIMFMDNLVKDYTTSVTKCGDLSPFWGFSECSGNLFLRKLPKNTVLMYMFWRLKNLFTYCGDKFGNFLQKKMMTFSSKHLVTLTTSCLC